MPIRNERNPLLVAVCCDKALFHGSTPRASARFFARLFCGIVFLALCSSVLAANSVAQLTDSLRHGFVAQDAKAIARLVYWGEAPDELKASFERRVTRFFGRRWLSVDMASIPDDLQARYERQGIQWELTLMPLLQIKVVLESLGNTESLDFLIGQKSGQFYLISAQPEKKAQPDVQP